MKAKITLTETDVKELIVSWAKSRGWGISEFYRIDAGGVMGEKSPSQKLFIHAEVEEEEDSPPELLGTKRWGYRWFKDKGMGEWMPVTCYPQEVSDSGQEFVFEHPSPPSSSSPPIQARWTSSKKWRCSDFSGRWRTFPKSPEKEIKTQSILVNRCGYWWFKDEQMRDWQPVQCLEFSGDDYIFHYFWGKTLGTSIQPIAKIGGVDMWRCSDLVGAWGGYIPFPGER